MKRSLACTLTLACALVGAMPAAAYETALSPVTGERGVYRHDELDYARVIRVDRVSGVDGRQAGGPQQRCYTRTDRYDSNGYSPYDPYERGDGYGSYRGDGGYRDDRHAGGKGSAAGRAMATVVGGVLGAVVGSQMGNGSGRYVASSVGSMIGGIAGQQVYESAVRNRQREQRAEVTVCDPVPAGHPDAYSGYSSQPLYEVTYEYAGRTYTERTSQLYRPGDPIRVRVDVRPN